MIDARSDIPPEQAEEWSCEPLTVGEVAELLHVHPNTIRKWSDNGLLKTYRVGPRGDRRFDRQDVNSFVLSGMPPQGSVLIVDDDPGARQLLGDIAGERHCLVTSVESGERALEELEKQCFDLVFLDLVLPGLNGLEVLRSIKAGSNSIPVAVITGYGEDAIALKAMSLGPMFFIRKPLNMAGVVQVLNATIA